MIDHRQTTDILVSSFKYVQYSTVQYCKSKSRNDKRQLLLVISNRKRPSKHKQPF
jgi:hypothetical protein